MRKKFLVVILLLLLVFLSACVISPPDPNGNNNGGPPRAEAVYLFAINDTHGAFYSENNYPGLENIAGLLGMLEAKGDKYIKIAVGDIFQGSYISNIHHGLPMVKALNLMEFDAFVIGNHEFDWGIDKIAVYKDGNPENGEADFPFLAANIRYKGEKLPWTDDYLIVESEGYKVGIIGVIGYGLESSIAADKVEGYEFLDPVPIVENLALKLRSEHLCDLVIAATHNYSSYFNLNVTNFLEASFVDAIVCAHTHQRINESEIRLDGYEVPIIQSNDKNQTAGEIIFKFNKSGKLLSAKARHYYPDRYQADSKVLALIESYAADIAAGERIIGYTVEKLYRDRLGLEITKAMKNKYQVDVAFINTGGVRETLTTGPITVKDVYQVFPFDNAVILTDISGSQLRSLYYNQRSYLYYNDDFDFDAIESDTIYRIAIIDYIYYRSYYTMYFEEYEPEFTSNLMRDVFIEYLEEYYPL